MSDWAEESPSGGGGGGSSGFGEGRSGGFGGGGNRGSGFGNRGFGRRDDDSGRGRGGGGRNFGEDREGESGGRSGYNRRDDDSNDRGFRGGGRGGFGNRGGRDRDGGGFGGRDRDRDGGGFGSRDRDGGGGGYGRDRDGGGGGFGNRDRDGGSFGNRDRDGGGFGGRSRDGGFGGDRDRDRDGGGYRGRGGFRGGRSGDYDDDEGGQGGGFRSSRGRGGDGGSNRGFGSRSFGGGSKEGGGDSDGFVVSRSFVNSSSDDRGRGRGGFSGGRGGGGFRGGRGDRDEDGGQDSNSFGGRGDRFEDGPRPEPYIPPTPSTNEDDIFVNVTKGINFGRYDNIPVQLTGREPINSISTFGEARLSDTVAQNVTKAGYNQPTPVQKYGIPVVLGGRDLMGCAQTGSGKTAAFLLPILSIMVSKSLYQSANLDLGVAHPTALIVAPTRELALQIHHEARKFAFRTVIEAVVAYGGTSVSYQLNNLAKGCNVLVGTPGRLIDFMNRGRVKLDQVKFLVLDEADRMLDMGFIPDVKKIVHEFDMCAKQERQTLMFSATFPEEIQRLAADFLNDYLFLTVGKVGGAANDIVQKVVEVAALEKREKLAEILRQKPQDKVLVFVETKRQADFLATYLSQEQFPTTSIHGARLQREREEALLAFKLGKTPVLVATSVAARGLDIPKVNHVVNFDMPSDISEYVHRIGRTGRIGHTGLATSFFDSAKDMAIARSLVKILSDAEQDVPTFLEEMAESAIGTGYGASGGGFGGTDRRERGSGGRDFGNRSEGYGGQSFGDPINTGFGNSAPPKAGDDESWD